MRMLVMMFPHSALRVPRAAIHHLTARVFSPTIGAGAVVSPYLARLGQHIDNLGGATGARFVHSALDLVSTLLLDTTQQHGFLDNPHQELLDNIHAYIEENLASPSLGPTAIAAAHFISPRLVHSLFNENGTTVSTWIRQRRLDRCRRDLLDPAHAHVPIAALAARWGFADAAHFSRTFKAAFGLTPRAYRGQA